MPKIKEQDKPKTELTMAQRFTNAVVKAYSDVAQTIEVTPKQMNLISNYYIKLDEMFRDPKVDIKWNQIRLPELATTVAFMSKLNLDMRLGHLSFMPFRHGQTGTYDLAPAISKQGYWYIAKTYGIDPPERYVVELVYSNDTFCITKRDANHDCDSYVFEVKNPFDRGKIIGGFGYLEFKDKSKNIILAMSEAEILKYRPPKYSQQFWAGENMKKMYEKTIAKQLLKRVPLDPDKVNDIQDVFKKIEVEELNFTSAEAKNEILENMCSGEIIDIDFEETTEPIEGPVEEPENVNLLGETIEDD